MLLLPKRTKNQEYYNWEKNWRFFRVFTYRFQSWNGKIWPNKLYALTLKTTPMVIMGFIRFTFKYSRKKEKTVLLLILFWSDFRKLAKQKPYNTRGHCVIVFNTKSIINRLSYFNIIIGLHEKASIAFKLENNNSHRKHSVEMPV